VVDTWFQTGRFDGWTVAIAEVGPGNTRSATIAVRALTHFKPEIAAFVGVAGGVASAWTVHPRVLRGAASLNMEAHSKALTIDRS
jgi:nucleoside phosphorylase